MFVIAYHDENVGDTREQGTNQLPSIFYFFSIPAYIFQEIIIQLLQTFSFEFI